MTGQRGDRTAALIVVVFAFSVGLGVATVAIPLLALSAGYDPATIGVLVAITAASQLGARLALPWLLGRFSDRGLISIASVLMVAGFGLLLVSTAFPVFALAQLLQGLARAVFWTSSQTHAVRSGGRPVERLVDINIASNAGTLIGPALAGMLATFGLSAAVVASVVGAAFAVLGTPFLQRHPPYDRRQSAGSLRLLGRPGLDVAVWASVVGGTWWSMLGSYIPVILVHAGIGPSGVGWMVTGSEGAAILALIALRRLAPGRIGPVVWAGSLTAMAALAALAIVPGTVVALMACLIVGGAANGTITTLAPAMSSLAAAAEEQGDALSLTGTFRAASLLVSPAVASALLAVLTVPAAVVAVAVTLAAPGLPLARGRRSAPVERHDVLLDAFDEERALGSR